MKFLSSPPHRRPARAALALALCASSAPFVGHAQGVSPANTPADSPTSARRPPGTDTSAATPSGNGGAVAPASPSAGPNEPPPSSAPRAPRAPRAPSTTRAMDVSGQAAGTLLRLTIPGEWQVRGNALTDIPLEATPGELEPRTLGQQNYFEMWFRFRPVFSVGDHFRLVGQFDVARGSLFGQSTRQVSLSRDSRDYQVSLFPVGVFDVRWLYVDWETPIGVLRAGQQGSHWGLGMLANDGDHAQTFGDYRTGDIVERLAFATRPGGRTSNFVLAAAGDLVFRDRLAQLVEQQVSVEGLPRTMGYDVGTRPLGNDRAWQAVLSAFYQRHDCAGDDCDRKRLGAYFVYRDQHNRVGDALYRDDFLRVFVGDVFARWEWPSPDGRARVWAGAELAVIGGRTTITRNVQIAEQTVLQLGATFEVGMYRENAYRVVLEGGYASGDGNPVDGTQSRFTFNPNHRVGMLLFPELIAWQTARSASIASDPRILGQPTRGAELLPSSGGVTNAMYLYPNGVFNVHRLIDVRAGAVIAQSTSDVVDPVQVVSYGVSRNYRGGDSRFRDLGLELDLGLMARIPIAAGLVLTGGAQGAVLFPGRAFADAAGNPMGVQATVQGRAGLTF